MTRTLGAVLAVAAAFPLHLAAQSWCDESRWDRDDVACEEREMTLSARSLTVDAGLNGGIEVLGEDRSDVLIVARVQSRARSEDRAFALLDEIRIRTDGGRVEADGPSQGRGESWAVSYRVFVPRSTDLDLETHNGGIGVEGVDGVVRFDALNGGIHLADLAGDVRGRTTNGGVHVELEGTSWNGVGLDVTTTNGGVTIRIPTDYSADLETGTVNGGMDLDFPLTLQGRIGRSIRTQLGDGGPPVRVVTTNGGVRLARR